MKVLVAVKRCLDYNVPVRLNADGSGIDLGNLKMSMNPFDEIAVEEAVRLKERGLVNDVLVTSIGPREAIETIRTALAMGADRAIHVLCDEPVEPLAVAKILKAVCLEERPDLVLTGKQAIDDDCSQVGAMLAALLGWGQATFAHKIDVADGSVEVEREVDGGLETVAVTLPAVVSVDLRLNEPRYASLPNMMKARKKPVTEKTPADYHVDTVPRLTVLGYAEPAKRAPGVTVASIDELIAKLDEAGVL